MATGAEFKPRTLIESTLANQPVSDGTLYVTTDTKRLYIDVDQSRILVDGNIYLETEAQKNMILAPLSNKLYIVKASRTMYLYTSEGWVTLGGSSGEGGTSNYEELTNLPLINSVQVVGDKSLADFGVASLDLDNLSTAGINVIKSYAGATESTLSKDVEELKSQVGDISAILDSINGEIV